ncbi:MAG: protein phosphatase 2C domain-containing protein [Lachnospiraceae bacterium]|nr:protein phosphatase 2C domain-containing protein [Lachnospiraceae bacterium]
MSMTIFGHSAQGASHGRIEKKCQDSWDKIDYEPGLFIATVADGHGSDKSVYSDEGSWAATTVFKKVLRAHYKNFNDEYAFETFLVREGDGKFAQIIDREWKRSIMDVHKTAKRDMNIPPEEIYRLYGSTLIGIAILNEFVFAFQIGDGDITYVDENTVEALIEADKLLGVETHSLCKIDAWKRAISVVKHKDIDDNKPYMYMLTTDGFANSYSTQDMFYQTCKEYYELMRQHGVKAVRNNLGKWLTETSYEGCGDDITAVFAYNE